MSERTEHPYLPKLKEQLAEGRVDRREFLRTATLLGVSAGAAYAFANKVAGLPFARSAKAAMPKGGKLRIGLGVIDISSPHTISSQHFAANMIRQVCEHLTVVGHDNVTRPYLLEGWSASEDVRTWTLNVRKGVKWHGGRDFTADDVIWNLKRNLDPETGSSVLGLMKSYMITEKDGKSQLWDANAIERVDSHTVRLNAKVGNLAIPEHLFHYPLFMLNPEEDGVFKVGSKGTGAFDLIAYEPDKNALYRPRTDYWGDGPYIDSLEFLNIAGGGELAALAAKQVDGLVNAPPELAKGFNGLAHVQQYQVATGTAALVRGKVTHKPFDDPKVRLAMRYATDSASIVRLTLGDFGSVGEHWHVGAMQPDHAPRPPINRDVAKAKQLLAEAGHPDGIDIEMTVRSDIAFFPNGAQGLSEQWKEAGIRVTLKPVPRNVWGDQWNKAPLTFVSWDHRPLGVMILGLVYRSGVPWNESEWSNAEFDTLLTEAEGLVDVEERRKVMAKIAKLMQEVGPITQPIFRNLVTWYDKKVQGFKMHPMVAVWPSELGIKS
jgi:peptide/nickel transport system substrate-binding protein